MQQMLLGSCHITTPNLYMVEPQSLLDPKQLASAHRFVELPKAAQCA